MLKLGRKRKAEIDKSQKIMLQISNEISFNKRS